MTRLWSIVAGTVTTLGSGREAGGFCAAPVADKANAATHAMQILIRSIVALRALT
jgi:hypothetical protein